MARTDWFVHDRFGMFVHFGLYSGPAGVWNGKRIQRNYAEWLQASELVPRSTYRELTKQFNPQRFDADAWMDAVVAAGMKYFVITSKHHDGFALWPSKASSYNVADATPFQRDILGELAAAAKQRDIKFGLYYSHWQDWDGSGGDVSPENTNDEYTRATEAQFDHYWQNKCLPQITELLEAYDPAFLWFDTWDDQSHDTVTPKRQEQLIDLIRERSDSCLINSRIQFTDPSPCVDFMSTMDNTFPDEGFEKPWETSGTLNDSWGYHQLDADWKSTESLIGHLVDNASLGGNYQLNVGPMGDGSFQPAAIRRLREIGAWLEVNGESIYGTQAYAGEQPAWGRITQRTLDDQTTRLFLHLRDYQPDVTIKLDLPTHTPKQTRIIETGQPVPFLHHGTYLTLELPATLAGISLPVVALDMA